MKVCIPIKAKNTNDLLKKMEIATKKADIIELWLGELEEKIDLEHIWKYKKTPLLINVKGEKEQGTFTGTDEEKLNILLKGAQLNAEYIDVDSEFPEEMILQLRDNMKSSQLILSAHFFTGTPSLPSLLNRIARMKKLGADIVKIAAMANEDKDLITILRLAENLKRQHQPFIAISMGTRGKPSRVLTPLLGGEMMFAALDQTQATALGQMTVEEAKKCFAVFEK